MSDVLSPESVVAEALMEAFCLKYGPRKAAEHVTSRLRDTGHTIVPSVQPPLPLGTIGYWPVWMVKVDEAFNAARHEAIQRLMDAQQAALAAAAAAEEDQ